MNPIFKIYVRLVNTGFTFDQAHNICEGIYDSLEKMGVKVL